MSISVDLAKRYEIKSEYYKDYDGKGEYDNHVVSIEPNEDDVVSFNGAEVCRGRFLGHPNDDKSLYLIKSNTKQYLYEDDWLLMEGDNLFIYGDLCIQQCENKCYIVNLKDNSEIASIDNVSFKGYDAEHKAFAFGDKVYVLDGNELTECQGEAKVLKFDMPTYDIKAEAYTVGLDVRQTNQYESIAKHTYAAGIQDANGNLLVFEPISQNAEIDRQALVDIYVGKLLDYRRTPQQKKEIDGIRTAYSILYNEDISRQKDEGGFTPFERLLCHSLERCFPALKDFYLDDLKKATDVNPNIELNVAFVSRSLFSKSSNDKLSDDDIKLMADFIARNPHIISRFSNVEFLPLAKASPEMVVNWVKASDSYDKTIEKLENLKALEIPARLLAFEILQKNGIKFYFKEDFVLAPNKEFWECVKDNGFGEPYKAFNKLCNALKCCHNKDSFFYVTTKEMLREFLQDNPKYATGSGPNWSEDEYAKFLVEHGLTTDEKMIARTTEFAKISKIQRSLDAIQYGKRDISLNCRLEDIVDFTDCDYAAPRYHLSNESKTTFLNEMLIYGKGKEAAYALSHGASPFQKIEFFRGKKTGMPFAGVFLRTMKDNFSGVQSLMNEIARNLDAKSGQQIIADIEKSLGQNLRQMPEVVQIMKNMRETFMHAKFEYEKKHREEQKYQKELDESRKFKAEHQQEIDELDKAYRIATRQKIDEYFPIFDGEKTFDLGTHSVKLVLYTQENLDQVKEKIVELEAHHQLVDEIVKKLVEKNENTGKSLADRFNELGYDVEVADNGVTYRPKDNLYYPATTIPFSQDTLTDLDEFVAKQEKYRRIEQEQKLEKLRQIATQEKKRQQKEQYEAMGLPSDVQVWHRVGAGTMCGDGWVIKSDGSFREPDTFTPKKKFSSDGFKCWKQILPGEVALSWKKDSAASEHDFEVIYVPQEGLSNQQKEQILKIEEDIQEEWKDCKGISSGEPSPSVGYGWNICGRKEPLLRDEEYEFSQQDTQDVKNINTSADEEAADIPDRPATTEDLAALMKHFGGNGRK